MDKFVETNGIRLHYLDHPGGTPPILLMHGLTANAHAFDDYVRAGLSPRHRLLSVDLRGRGLSSKPDTGYSIAEHARDIVGMLDTLGIDQIVMGGHSFGALVTIYVAAHFPERVSRLLLIDAAARLHPNVREMVAPSILRLGQTWPSFDDYLAKIRSAPYLGEQWLPQMTEYYRADVRDLPGGKGITTHSSPAPIQQAIEGALGLGEQWLDHIRSVVQPALLVNATGPYGPPDAPAILPRELAMETVEMMRNCRYAEVPGNHLTMLFGQGADATVAAIHNFLGKP